MWAQKPHTAEAAGSLLAIRNAPCEQDLTIVCRTPHVRDKHLSRWENEGWVGVKDRDVLRCLAAEMKTRTGQTLFLVDERGDMQELKQANARANNACDTSQAGTIPVPILPGYELPGVKLANIRQRIVYHAIREWKNAERKKRESMEERVADITADVLHDYDRAVDPENIWLSAHTKDIALNTRNFIWRMMHDSFRLGRKWEDIPRCEDFGVCELCGAEETIQHILLECKHPGQEQVWAEAKALWAKTGLPWRATTLGGILACGLATFPNRNGKLNVAKQWLFRILVSEAAGLIWKIRCERVMEPENPIPDPEAVRNRFFAVINVQLDIDRVLAKRSPKEALASLDPGLVLETWTAVVTCGADVLPKNWLREPRVLVGTTRHNRPNGQNR
uniref:Reverse transcriptase zinc-binding domain-containing protein n=1 Tax=Mycena chlorophos TaxID=658473 RepID=A0ABQ0L7T6_MYCCL|nr:predicted protein [Mycena chlorophos]